MTLSSEVRHPVEDFLRPDEVAKHLRISLNALVRLRKRGEGPPWVQITERSFRYPASELREYLKERQRGGGHK